MRLMRNLQEASALITACNEVGAKSCFHRCVWFCSWGGCLPQCMLGYTPPWSRHPLGADPPEQTSPEQTPPRADTPQSRHPPEQTPRGVDPPGADTPPQACCEIQSTRGRYACYWNAILFNLSSDNFSRGKLKVARSCVFGQGLQSLAVCRALTYYFQKDLRFFHIGFRVRSAWDNP